MTVILKLKLVQKYGERIKRVNELNEYRRTYITWRQMAIENSFLAIFDPRLSILESHFDCRLPGVIKGHADVNNRARGVILGLILHVHPYLVYVNSEGYHEFAHMRRLACGFVACRCDKNRNFTLPTGQFCMLFLSSADFLGMSTFSENTVRNTIIKSVKQIGSRSIDRPGPTFCRAWSGFKLFAKVISRRH